MTADSPDFLNLSTTPLYAIEYLDTQTLHPATPASLPTLLLSFALYPLLPTPRTHTIHHLTLAFRTRTNTNYLIALASTLDPALYALLRDSLNDLLIYFLSTPTFATLAPPAFLDRYVISYFPPPTA